MISNRKLSKINLRFEHLAGTGRVRKRPFGSPVPDLLAALFLTSLIAGLARHMMMQQHTESEKSVIFIYEK